MNISQIKSNKGSWHKIKYKALVVLMALLTACGGSEPEVVMIDPMEEEEEEKEEEVPPQGYSGTIRDITSKALVSEMGVGWNLGNTFDVTEVDKTAWGNPLPTREVIEAVKNIGFTTVRIPVTWETHQNEFTFEIEADYMARVKDVVNYAFDNDMFVILNTHHENGWVRLNSTDAESVEARLNGLWTQVANEFIEYGDSLIFETLNEPRTENTPNEWTGGTAAERTILNSLNKACLDAIRNTGGNNEKRHIMIPTYAASTGVEAMDELAIPNDDPNVIISLHSYFPWSFAGQGSNDWGSDLDKSQLLAELDKIKSLWLDDRNRAVVMGEWGAIRRNDTPVREEYYTFYTKACLDRDLIPVVWDDGGDFQLLDRNTYSWVFRSLAEAIVNAN